MHIKFSHTHHTHRRRHLVPTPEVIVILGSPLHFLTLEYRPHFPLLQVVSRRPLLLEVPLRVVGAPLIVRSLEVDLFTTLPFLLPLCRLNFFLLARSPSLNRGLLYHHLTPLGKRLFRQESFPLVNTLATRCSLWWWVLASLIPFR